VRRSFEDSFHDELESDLGNLGPAEAHSAWVADAPAAESEEAAGPRRGHRQRGGGPTLSASREAQPDEQLGRLATVRDHEVTNGSFRRASRSLSEPMTASGSVELGFWGRQWV